MYKLTLSPAFLLVFSTVFSITLFSGCTSLWLGSRPILSEYQIRNLEDSRASWQMGIGCIFGLLGSKSNVLMGEEKENNSK
jgi:hypothetical protein